jgi:hypothetical protein
MLEIYLHHTWKLVSCLSVCLIQMNFIKAVRKIATVYYDNHTKPIDIFMGKIQNFSIL